MPSLPEAASPEIKKLSHNTDGQFYSAVPDEDSSSDPVAVFSAHDTTVVPTSLKAFLQRDSVPIDN